MKPRTGKPVRRSLYPRSAAAAGTLLLPQGFLAAFLAAAFLSAGCSSQPKGEQTVVEGKNRAAQYAEYANFYLQQGEYSLAKKLYTQALQENLAVDNRAGAVLNYNSLGKLFTHLDEPGKAETYYHRSLSLAKDLEDPVLIAQSVNHLGELALSTGNTAAAWDRFKEGLRLMDREKGTPEKAILLHNAGTAAKARNDQTQARELFTEALAINTRLQEKTEAASNHYMLASVLAKQNQIDEARFHLNEALALDKEVENSYGIAQDLAALAALAEKTGKPEEALELFNRARQIYQIRGRTDQEIPLLKKLINLAEKLNDPRLEEFITRQESFSDGN